MNKNWFESWFDTPYYHTLYKHRNDKEAKRFITNIIAFLKLPKNSHIADLPCGKGRHARYLNSLGYKVSAGDLSKNSIDYAKQFENDSLSFEICDMRAPLNKTYNAVFNLFTSFGYFDDDSQDINILKNMRNSLAPNGTIVIDYLNINKAITDLKPHETKIIDGITFDISKEFKNNFIYKHIRFSHNGKNYHYTEQIKHLDLEKFEHYFKSINMNITATFGNYSLDKFNKKTADRLIIVAK